MGRYRSSKHSHLRGEVLHGKERRIICNITVHCSKETEYLAVTDPVWKQKIFKHSGNGMVLVLNSVDLWPTG
jgi:hypothetical protein